MASCTSVPKGFEPVDGFELDRYLGTWYEIARLDHSFERGLDNVSAIYSLKDDGGIRVLNSGFNPNTKTWKQAQGKAYFVNDEKTAHLKVSFFGPFYGSYIIFYLDNYKIAMVVGPNKSYFWILSRTKYLPEKKLKYLVGIADRHGVDTKNLIFLNHK